MSWKNYCWSHRTVPVSTEVHAYSAYVWHTSSVFQPKASPFLFYRFIFATVLLFFSHCLYNTSVQLAYEKRLSSEISQLKWLLCLSHFFCNQFNTVCSSSDHSGQPQMKMPLIHISASGNFCRTNAVLIGKCIQAFFSGLFLALHQDLPRWFPSPFFAKAHC